MNYAKGENSMRTSYLAIVALLCGCFPFLYAKVPGERNELKELCYHQGELVDTIVCHFEGNPACIYEPTPTYRKQEGRSQATFFLPFAYMSNTTLQRVVNQINTAGKEGYTIALEPVTKPIRGLRLRIVYNPGKVGWEYGPLDISHKQRGLIFKIYNKELLRTIGEKTSPLRWYAQAKHQPRIVVDSASIRHTTGQRDSAASMAAHIASFLRSHGCEVLISSHTDRNVSPGIRASYANLYAHADLLLSLSMSPLKQVEVFTLSPALLKVRQSTLTDDEQARIGHIIKWVHVQSALLETALDEKLQPFTKKQEVPLLKGTTQNRYSEVLLGAEMPALCVQLGISDTHRGESYYTSLAQAIGSGILLYISEKKFLKTLYKDKRYGKLKVIMRQT